ncbi:hypothetical protein [Gemmatimonas sp.]|uniref:hypothetical protein n=1 Tax=Gemmatimonas sp. TaxID=1962908 RepID=UPI003F722932
MLAIVSLVGSLIGGVWAMRQTCGRAQPPGWAFGFFVAVFISSVPMVFFDDSARVKTAAAVISGALFLFALSLMARHTSLDRGQ